jgi:hypothetical protein
VPVATPRVAPSAAQRMRPARRSALNEEPRRGGERCASDRQAAAPAGRS